MDLLQAVLGVFLGGIITIATILYVEYLKKPKFSFEVSPRLPLRAYGPDKPAQEAQFVQVQLWNRPKGRIQKFLNKIIGLDTALSCHGDINFYPLDGDPPLFSEPMRLRWAGHQDQLIYQVQEGNIITGLDLSKLSESYWRTCYPERREIIEIAARFDDDIECYGWTTESMIGDPLWRKPKWKMDKGRYLVKVTVRPAADKALEVFLLDNSSSIDHFRLVPVSPEVKFKLRAYQRFEN